MTNEEYQNYSIELDKETYEDAIAKGFEIVRSTDRTLLLDLDTQELVHQFNSQITFMSGLKLVDVDSVQVWHSKSSSETKRKLHAVVWLNTPIDSKERRLAFQAMLGSDPKKCVFDTFKLDADKGDWCRLFKPPTSASISIPWLKGEQVALRNDTTINYVPR